MPGFSSYDDLINEATTSGKTYDYGFYKVAPAAAEAAGVWQSLWTGVGNPGVGSAPATTPGTQYDDTAGGIFFPDQASDFKFLMTIDAMATQNCTLMFYDRLVGVSGLSMVGTGNKTVSSSALTRYTSTAAVVTQAWLEVTTATTVTAPILSMNSYTSGDGASGQAGGSVTFPAAATDLHTLVRLPEAAGKTGVQAVSTINVATAASAGVVNLIIIRPLAYVPLLANVGNKVNMFLDFPSFMRIYDGATIGIALLASVTTATTVWGNFGVVYG